MLKNRIKNFFKSAIKDALRGNIGRQISYIGNDKVLTRDIYGHKIICYSQDISLTPHILLDGYWENWITTVFRNEIKQGMTVVDVGANLGWYSLQAAELVGETGRVESFEANPLMADIVASNFSINGYLDRASVHCVAVYSKNTELMFNVYKKHVGSSSIWVDDKSVESFYDHVEKIKVRAKTLDSIFDNKDIDFIKIDAEGAEMHILSGAEKVLNKNKNIKLLMEFSPKLIEGAHGTVENFYTKLSVLGFYIKRITTESKLVDLPLKESK